MNYLLFGLKSKCDCPDGSDQSSLWNNDHHLVFDVFINLIFIKEIEEIVNKCGGIRFEYERKFLEEFVVH